MNILNEPEIRALGCYLMVSLTIENPHFLSNFLLRLNTNSPNIISISTSMDNNNFLSRNLYYLIRRLNIFWMNRELWQTSLRFWDKSYLWKINSLQEFIYQGSGGALPGLLPKRTQPKWLEMGQQRSSLGRQRPECLGLGEKSAF